MSVLVNRTCRQYYRQFHFVVNKIPVLENQPESHEELFGFIVLQTPMQIQHLAHQFVLLFRVTRVLHEVLLPGYLVPLVPMLHCSQSRTYVCKCF